MEEKFQKLKDVYTKLREEHIQLIRTKAEVDKQLLIAKHASEEAIRLKDEISLQMTELLAEKNKTEEKMAQAEDIAGEAELWKAQKEALQNDNLVIFLPEPESLIFTLIRTVLILNIFGLGIIERLGRSVERTEQVGSRPSSGCVDERGFGC